VTDTKIKGNIKKITDGRLNSKAAQTTSHCVTAHPGGCMVLGLVLLPLACWDWRCESRRGHGFLSSVRVAFCELEVSATGWSFVRRSPTECGVSEGRLQVPVVRRAWLVRGCCNLGKNLLNLLEFHTNVLCFVRRYIYIYIHMYIYIYIYIYTQRQGIVAFRKWQWNE